MSRHSQEKPVFALFGRCVAALGVVAVLAACSSTATSAPAAAPTSNADQQGQGRGFPGVNGLVAAISGSTLQVQGNNQQTTVTHTAATVFTDAVPASFADVKVGMCVTARPTPLPSGAPSPAAHELSAANVMITLPVNGSCDNRGPFGGGRPSGVPRGDQQGSVRPSGGPRNFRGFGGATGKVTSVSGTTFVVVGTPRPGASPAPDATVATTVTTSASTTYTKTVKATAAALAVGKCVTALGKTDATGAVAATMIAIRAAVNGSCGGFGGGRG